MRSVKRPNHTGRSSRLINFQFDETPAKRCNVTNTRICSSLCIYALLFNWSFVLAGWLASWAGCSFLRSLRSMAEKRHKINRYCNLLNDFQANKFNDMLVDSELAMCNVLQQTIGFYSMRLFLHRTNELWFTHSIWLNWWAMNVMRRFECESSAENSIANWADTSELLRSGRFHYARIPLIGHEELHFHSVHLLIESLFSSTAFYNQFQSNK